jgi:hypothetical protein
MNNREQEDFIRQNRKLPLEQLAAKTGLRQMNIRKILERTPREQRPSAPSLEAGAISPKGTNPFFYWAAALLPALLAVLFYLPVLKDGFINLDDHQYILDNVQIRSINAGFFHWCFTTFYQGNWIPLAWISLALDYAVGKLNPEIYHLHSLILHALNTLLVFFLCLRISSLAGRGGADSKARPEAWAISAAFLTAILFGLHPLHVESVAWANEQRDLLCGFFYLLSLLI